MKYSLTFDRPEERLITIRIPYIGNGEPILFYLSKWRPGRYELQRFDRNISDVKISVEGEEPQNLERLTTHSWRVDSRKDEPFEISYTYFADQLDGGGSYYDREGIYINGVNLFLYTEETLNEPCEVSLTMPQDYKIACGLNQKGHTLYADSYHQLVDGPFLAGANLVHHQFEVAGIPTNFWFRGPCDPDFEIIEADVRRYTEQQMKVFGDFPVKEYHYLCVMRPDKFRHGVEHFNSTVIAMGPGYRLHAPDFYRSFIEICSHELFHTWNVKSLRPADMFPYDYGGENYSKLHFVTEGVTTYYGDLMIWKGGAWDMEAWLQSLNGELKRFYQSGGKDVTSLEQSSLESWINGYNQTGTPNRRISFYTKGYLVAFLLDIKIRKATHNQQSLDQVIRLMYQRIAKMDRGYTREDYKGIAEEVSGLNLDAFFEAYISGVQKLDKALTEAGEYVGLELQNRAHPSLSATYFGIEWAKNDKDNVIVSKLYPNSPGLKAGLSIGDELVSLEGWKADENVEDLFTFLKGGSIEICFFHGGKLKTGTLKSGLEYLGYIPQFFEHASPTPAQLENRKEWQTVKIGIKVKN